MTDEPPQTTPPQTPPPPAETTAPVKSSSRRAIGIIIGGILVLALFAAGIVLLATAPEGTTARVRDIFIIFMAIESLVLGVGLIILIIQLATLINLLQNEIKPILDSTNETVNNLRGTTQFLSNNLVEPVLKLNEYLAGLRKFLDFIRPDRR
ncbi:MAG: hypothetical protein AB1453_00955 [Chloroflexota bacterium]|jgi:hypothetical protein